MKVIDKQVFPYLPPDIHLKEKYKYVFNIKKPVKVKALKRFFDIFASLILLTIFFPFILLIIFSYFFEMLMIPSRRGYIFYYYYSVSGGIRFKKYKIRTIKKEFIDHELDKNHIWGAHKNEWNKEALTFNGKLIKMFYLDEVPQLLNILKGDISLIGPRALSEDHYQADIDQGNTYRKIIKAGLIGLGHANKGTSEMGNPKFEYEYLDNYLKSSFFKFYFLEFKIILKSTVLILKGGGH